MRIPQQLSTLAFLLYMAITAASAQTITFVHPFDITDGQYLGYQILAQGTDGNLYGTTYLGGALGEGNVFRQSSKGRKNVVLHNFGGSDGANPNSGLTLATDGYFYGTTSQGGPLGWGVLYRISPFGAFEVLYNFTGAADGGLPQAAPIEASDGNLYGTTGGLSPSVYPTVYRFSTAQGLTTIYTFPTVTAQPLNTITQATDGNLYVPAYRGGPQGCGSITGLTTAGTVVSSYNFSCDSGGDAPIGALTLASDGDLYGTASEGGTYGKGTIFRFSPETVQVTSLYSFGSSAKDGDSPFGTLTQGTDGNLYGSTAYGGTDKSGTLFNISLTGQYGQIYSFTKAYINSISNGLGQHTSGTFFGTAGSGGPDKAGAVFTLNMGLGPFVAFVLPVGAAGQSAQILGQGFTGTTAVTFNGVPATSFKVASDTFLTAIVPSGATTGKVVVTTPGGALTSNVNFRITQ